MTKGKKVELPEIPNADNPNNVPVIPEAWRDIKKIEECLWTISDVSDRPSKLNNCKKLSDAEASWRKCFNLYPIGEVLDSQPTGTYQLVGLGPNERICTPVADHVYLIE